MKRAARSAFALVPPLLPPLPLLLLLLLCGATTTHAGDLRWAFEHGCAHWRVGMGPVASAFTDGAELSAPVCRNGLLQVVGVSVERIFVDSTGYIRRGVGAEEWLLSPVVGAPAQTYTRIHVVLNGSPGGATVVQIQWLTESGRDALVAARARQSQLVLPDSVQGVVRQYQEGTIQRAAYESYMARWEEEGGRGYAAAFNRLQQEMASLKSLFQTSEQLVPQGDSLRTVEFDMRHVAGWKGQLLRVGVRLGQRPRVLDPLAGKGSPGLPFAGVHAIMLVGEMGTESADEISGE